MALVVGLGFIACYGSWLTDYDFWRVCLVLLLVLVCLFG